MRRKQFFFTERQEAYVKYYMEKWEVTEAEVVRRLLDAVIDRDSSIPKDPLSDKIVLNDRLAVNI